MATLSRADVEHVAHLARLAIRDIGYAQEGFHWEHAKIDVADGGHSLVTLDAIEPDLSATVTHERAISVIGVDLERIVTKVLDGMDLTEVVLTRVDVDAIEAREIGKRDLDRLPEQRLVVAQRRRDQLRQPDRMQQAAGDPRGKRVAHAGDDRQPGHQCIGRGGLVNGSKGKDRIADEEYFTSLRVKKI